MRLVSNGHRIAFRPPTRMRQATFVLSVLRPAAYKVTVEATGFAKSEVDITLLTEQNLNVPVTLKVGSISEAITVTTEAPVVDTADSRTQLTLENQAVARVAHRRPQPGHAGDDGARSFRPGNQRGREVPASGVDNFSTEEQVDASANGQGAEQ